MRNARLLGALAAAILVAAVGTKNAVVRHLEAPPTVTCRHLLESTEVGSLPATVVSDLRDPAFDVDVDALDLPAPLWWTTHGTHSSGSTASAPARPTPWSARPRPMRCCWCGRPTCPSTAATARPAVPGRRTEHRTCAELFSVAVPAGHVREMGCRDVG